MATFGRLVMEPDLPLEEEDFYLSPEGYRVFTEKYHLKRGYCCRSNCRHCPFDFDPGRAV